jgi:hypothetical protein
MSLSVRVFILMMGIFLFVTILELVRKRRFREELSIVWLLAGLGLILSSFADLIIDPLAFKLGFSYPPALVFMLAFFLFVVVILYFSAVVSDLTSKNKELNQKIALMEFKLGRLYKEED